MYSNLEYNGTFTTAASTSPWQLSKYFLRSYKILKINFHIKFYPKYGKATPYRVTFHAESMWYSTNVRMSTLTALYNFLESLWIFNAHQFVPITPLGHGHFGNRTFSVALICFLFLHRSYWPYADWIEYWHLIQEHVLLSTSGGHAKPTMQPDV